MTGKSFRLSIFCLLLVSASWLLSTERREAPKGASLLSGGIVAELIEKAAPGSVVVVPPGHYEVVNLVIRKPLTLEGQGKVIFDGLKKGEILRIEKTEKVTVRGIRFQNVGISFIEDWAAIRVKDSRNCQVVGNEIYNAFFGVYLENSRDCVVKKNKIFGDAQREVTSGNGVHAWHCKRIFVLDNHIRSHRDGVYFEFVRNSRIEGNVSERNLRYGLHFMFSHGNAYRYNVFRRNGAGVAVMYTRHVLMEHNIFEWNWGGASFGLLLKEIDDSQIRQNLFYYNTTAIYTEGSNRVEIEGNLFRRNGYAVKIMGNVTHHRIRRNNFVGNTFDMATNSTQNYGTVVEENYWDNYTGYDLTKDGVGDVPYYPISLFAYMVEQEPPTIILLRSFFVTLMDIAERVAPVLIPENFYDTKPLMAPLPLQPPDRKQVLNRS